MDDLKERLEVLLSDVDEAKTHGMRIQASILGMEVRELLEKSFRSGDLVTRSEMEEAVAKAVAEERDEGLEHELGSLIEATLLRINGEADLQGLDNFLHLNFPKQYAQFFKEAALRVRSEQKEGE